MPCYSRPQWNGIKIYPRSSAQSELIVIYARQKKNCHKGNGQIYNQQGKMIKHNPDNIYSALGDWLVLDEHVGFRKE